MSFKMNGLKKLTIILFFMVIIGGLSNCNKNRHIEQNLENAETLMQTSPDSALQILLNLDSASITNPDQEAHYALLLSQAKDKCSIYTTNDSLIAIALEYYSNNDYPRKNMLSHYYYGRVKYHAKDYRESMEAFHIAFDCAETDKDYFWKGMAARGISDIYYATYNFAEALEYSKIAYRSFKTSGRSLYANFAAYEVAACYTAFGDTKSSQKICDILSQFLTAHAYNNPDESMYYGLNEDVIKLKALNYSTDKDYKNELDTYIIISLFPTATAQDSANLSLAYIHNNQIKEAWRIYNRINIKDSILNSYIKYRLYSSSDKNNLALEALEEVHVISDRAFRNNISNSAAASALTHINSLRQEANKKQEASRNNLIFFVLCSLLLILIIILSFLEYRRNKENEIEKNIAIADELSMKLQIVESSHAQIQSNLANLLARRYKTLDELCQTVYSAPPKTTTKKISELVHLMIEQMKSDAQFLTQLEEEVNTHANNLFIDFRKDLPDLPSSYYRLFLFSFLGFSSAAMALLLDKDSPTKIWSMKRHLKDKIKTLPEGSKEKYLSAIR